MRRSPGPARRPGPGPDEVAALPLVRQGIGRADPHRHELHARVSRRRHALPHMPGHAIPPRWCAPFGRSPESSSPSRSRWVRHRLREGAAGVAKEARTAPRASPRRSCSRRARTRSRRPTRSGSASRPPGEISLTNPPSGPAALLERPPRAVRRGAGQPPDKASIDISLKVAGLPLQVNLTPRGRRGLPRRPRPGLQDRPAAGAGGAARSGATPTLVRLDQRPRGRRSREASTEPTPRRSRAPWTPRRPSPTSARCWGPRPSAPPTPRGPCAPAPSSSGSGRRTCCRGASIWCSRATGPASARPSARLTFT